MQPTAMDRHKPRHEARPRSLFRPAYGGGLRPAIEAEPEPPVHHDAPPSTSAPAAALVKPAASRLRQMVLAAIARASRDGAADAELLASLNLPGNTQRPRRKEPQEAGLIEHSGQRRPTPSRLAAVWVAREGAVT